MCLDLTNIDLQVCVLIIVVPYPHTRIFTHPLPVTQPRPRSNRYLDP